ncbi:MAG TPA: SRPBCC family protein [Solirubrobacteraceae bacterium]
MRAHHVHIEHHFSKPPERVFAHLAEHENLAEVFGAKVTRVRDGQDGERNGVGSVRRLQIGPLAPFEETVTEFLPSERIVYRITKGSPLSGHLGVMTFVAQGGGTRFVYDIRLASRIPGLALLVRAVLTRSITQALPKVDQQA